MPKPVLVLRVVVASPGDVKDERDSLAEILEEVNRDTASPGRLHLELSRWEVDAYPGFHPEGPQGLIDPILNIEHCDILIGIFWSRMGTPTPDGKTGTEHEFHAAFESWKQSHRPQIMTYFCERVAPGKTSDDKNQIGRVRRFRKNFPKEGLFKTYNRKTDFTKLVAGDLRTFLRDQIQAIWGRDARALQEMDSARSNRQPVIAILGRIDAKGPHDQPTADSGLAKAGLRHIGSELAKVGCQIMAYDSHEEYAATEIIRGYMGSGLARRRSIRIRRPLSLTQDPFPGQAERPDVFWDEPVEKEQWEIAFIPSIPDADGVVVAGNGQFTLLGGLQAVGARMPMLALAGYGGITADVWGVLKGQQLRLASDEEVALMARRESSPQWAAECVRALLDQGRRREDRQIWRV